MNPTALDWHTFITGQTEATRAVVGIKIDLREGDQSSPVTTGMVDHELPTRPGVDIAHPSPDARSSRKSMVVHARASLRCSDASSIRHHPASNGANNETLQDLLELHQFGETVAWPPGWSAAKAKAHLLLVDRVSNVPGRLHPPENPG